MLSRRTLGHSLCAIVTGAWLFTVQPAAGEPWKQYANPADLGWSAEKLEQCRQQAAQNGAAAVFVVVRGHVLAAWGPVERRFECHSVRKSLVSALLGNHVASGAIDLGKTLADLNIDDVPPLTHDERKARVVDLITSRSGVYHAAAKEPADMRAERPQRGSHPPGQHFWYNNWGFNAIGAIFEKQTGRKLFQAFRDEIAQPLGMEDFRLGDGLAELEPSSSIHAAHSFKLSARDLARVGWCMLDKGQWNGQQRIPAGWISDSTRVHAPTQRGAGYGYMWWVYPAGSLGDATKLDALNAHDKFAAIGTGGQFLLVVPALKFVLVHRADTANNRHVPGPKVWALAEQILDASTQASTSSPGSDTASPRLIALNPQPLAGVLPPPPEPPAVALDISRLADLTGEFEREDEPQRRIRFHVFEGRFFAHAPGLGETELFAASASQFFSRATNLQVIFERDADKTVRRVTATFQGESWPLRRLQP